MREEAVEATIGSRGQSGSKPQFNVRAKGVDGFVGAGWMQTGRFGKYISVKTSVDLPSGSVVFLHPRKDSAGII